MAAPKPRRTWPQRLTIAMLGLAALAAFGTAGGLAAGQWVISDRRIVDIQSSADNVTSRDPLVLVPGATAPPAAPPGDDTVTTTTTTLPIAEPNAANFLLTGADSGDCANSTDPTVGSRDSTRSDTIMVWRVNPDTDQVAVLSFPRDLYVEIPGRRNSRINAAYRTDEPQLLIDTIWQNFGVPIDHYIQVDFCAFRTLVDAVGGVEVPFEHPARDASSGLNVPEAGCAVLNGDMALAYVRSRKYQWQDENGDWNTDGTSDFGRIARQQDFIRRVLAKVISDELYRPDTIGALIETNKNYLVTDNALTPGRIIEFANALRHVDPAAIATYRIESRGINIGGAAMQEPLLGGDNMQAILAVFRGHATLAGAPEQVFATTVPDAADTDAASTTAPATPGTGPATTSAPLPTVVAENNNQGVSPDPLATC